MNQELNELKSLLVARDANDMKRVTDIIFDIERTSPSGKQKASLLSKEELERSDWELQFSSLIPSGK